MSRFNTSSRKTPDAVNYAGGQAWQMSDQYEFVTLVLTNFVTDQAYRDGNQTIERVRELMGTVDPQFAAKTAIFARNEYGMRSISHVIGGEIANRVKGEEWTKNFFSKLPRRIDDMAEILSYYSQLYDGSLQPIPNSIKKGFATRLTNSSEYELGKYQMKGKKLSLVDIVNLVHPKNTDALDKLMNGELTSETYQTDLTRAGQNAETEQEKAQLKAETWTKFVAKGDKVEYFALLRNLRNIALQADDVTFGYALGLLTKQELIEKSLVLPFRYWTAYKQFAHIKRNRWDMWYEDEQKENEPTVDSDRERMVRAAIADAMQKSLVNIPRFDGKTLVAIDVSGSMTGCQVAKSDVYVSEAAALFGLAVAMTNNADVITFDGDARYVNYDLDTSLAKNMEEFKFPGGSTNFKAIFRKANKAYERIVILSDMQGWDEWTTPDKEFKSYKQEYNCNPYVYSVDMQGYGSMQFADSDRIFLMAGFSEKMFDTMKMMEQDKMELIRKIEAIEL